MSIFVLFNPHREPAKIGALELEATIQERHDLQSTVTSDPVETGFTISDHVIRQPVEIHLEGKISDRPLQIMKGVLENVTNEFFSSENTDNEDNRLSQYVFDYLYEMQRNAQLINVLTNFKLYKDMVIEKLDIPYTKQTGRAIHFSAKCKHINFVTSQKTSIPADQVAKPQSRKDNGQGKTDKGNQDASNPDDYDRDVGVSIYGYGPGNANWLSKWQRKSNAGGWVAPGFFSD